MSLSAPGATEVALMKNELILSGSHLITSEAKSFCAKLKKTNKTGQPEKSQGKDSC